ncbi:MAG: GntR family transcriptional regulator [Thermodesulfobacteriota bacterium]
MIHFQKPTSLAEQIADYIGNKIIRWEIPPGERIREALIAEELGVSRSPVREALRILEKNRLIELHPRRGARVPLLTPEYIECLYDVLTELLALVGVKCTENSTPENLVPIQEAMEKTRVRAQAGDRTGYNEAVIQYGLACLAAAGNPLLERMIMDLLPSIRRVFYATFVHRTEDLLKNAEVVQLGTRYIEEGNAEMAARTVREWLQNEKTIAMTLPLAPRGHSAETING